MLGHCRDAAGLRRACPAPLLLGTFTHRTVPVGRVSGVTAPGEGAWSSRGKALGRWFDDCIQCLGRYRCMQSRMCTYGIYSRECTVRNVKCMINCIYLFIHLWDVTFKILDRVAEEIKRLGQPSDCQLLPLISLL